MGYINGIVSGASGRKRVQPEELESVSIPVPSKSIQEAIVKQWKVAEQSISAARADLDKSVCELEEWLHTKTDISSFANPWLALDWNAVTRWDVKTARAASFRLSNPNFVPFGYYAEEVTESAKPQLEPDKDWPIYGVNNTEGVFFSQFQKGSAFNTGYKRIRKDWFFHNPTRSAVGSLGIVPIVPDDAITSPEYQVWRLRNLDEESLLPQFVATLIRTSWFIKLIQFHRVGAVKQRLYVENLLEIPVHRFPRDLQKLISAARLVALDKLAIAKKRAEIVNQEVEEMILGTRPVKV
jgi:restriction endonuclease S subunit